VFPEKKIEGAEPVQIFFPVTSEAYFLLEKAISEHIK